jgi:hypothetical protein
VGMVVAEVLTADRECRVIQVARRLIAPPVPVSPGQSPHRPHEVKSVVRLLDGPSLYRPGGEPGTRLGVAPLDQIPRGVADQVSEGWVRAGGRVDRHQVRHHPRPAGPVGWVLWIARRVHSKDRPRAYSNLSLYFYWQLIANDCLGKAV